MHVFPLHVLEVTGSGSKPAESLLHLFRVKRHDLEQDRMKNEEYYLFDEISNDDGDAQ
jgi:hypothetical protein